MNPAKLLALWACVLFAQAAVSQEEDTVITEGTTVELEYTLRLGDGSVVQSNVDQEPLSYVHGEGTLLPALESALAGHGADDEVEVTLAPDDAYGQVNDELFRDVPIEQIPEGAREVGTMLQAQGFEGTIRVHEIRDETVILDFNHPLAGEELNFSIRVVSVNPDAVGE